MESTQQPKPIPVKSWKVRAGLMVAAIGLAGLFVLGLAPRLRSQGQLAAESREAAGGVPVVSVVLPHRAAAADLLLPGNIEAIEETSVGARTSGYLRRRYVDIGSHVKAGEVLAEIEAPDVDQQVSQAVAQTAQSRAAVGQSIATVAQMRANVAQMQGDVARQRAALEQSRAQLAGTQAKLAEAQAAEGQAEAQRAHAEQQLAVQRAVLNQAQTQLKFATVTNKRYQSLFQQGFVSAQDADQQQTAQDNAAAAVESTKAAVNAAQADVTSAQQAVTASKAVIASAQADVQAGRKNIQSAQAALTTAEATVRAAEATLRASQASVQANDAAVASQQANARRYAVLRSFEKVVAPFDGVITSRNVDTGALINAGGSADSSSASSTPRTGLFGLARTDVLRIQVQVPQSYVNAIRPGQPAKVLVREYPGRTFTGTVFQSAGALDSTSRTLLTEVHVRNPGNTLRPGMYAQVQFSAAAVRPLARIPANTLVVDAAGIHVASVTPDNKVRYLPVKVGRDFGTEIEITEGLKGNERLITDPTDDLKDGAAVSVGPAQK
jgi:RND family efflux transporter MFP subunit